MKKLFALALTASLALSLVSCGTKPSVDTPPSSKSAPSSVATQEPKYDFGGVTIKLAWAWPPLHTEPSEETDLFNARVKEVEEKLNVKFEWAQVDTGEFWDNMVTNTLAGNSPGQINFTYPWVFPGWQQAGLAADIGAIAQRVGLDMSDPSWIKMSRVNGMYDGKQYIFNKLPYEINAGMLFNKRLISEAGLKSPYEHVKEGTWNWATFEEYAKALTKVEADGTTLQWGYSSMDHQALGELLVLSNKGDLVDDSGDKPVVTADTENVLEALSLYQKMLMTDKTVLMNTQGDWEAAPKAFAEGKVAMLQAEQWIVDYVNTLEPEEFGFVYFPKGPKADDYVSTAGYFMFWIPAMLDEKTQEAALLSYSMLFDSLHPEISREEGFELMAEKYVHDEEGAAIYADMQTRDVFASLKSDKYGIDDWQLYNLLTDAAAGHTPQSAAAQQKPVMEAAITDFLAEK